MLRINARIIGMVALLAWGMAVLVSPVAAEAQEKSNPGAMNVPSVDGSTLPSSGASGSSSSGTRTPSSGNSGVPSVGGTALPSSGASSSGTPAIPSVGGSGGSAGSTGIPSVDTGSSASGAASGGGAASSGGGAGTTGGGTGSTGTTGGTSATGGSSATGTTSGTGGATDTSGTGGSPSTASSGAGGTGAAQDTCTDFKTMINNSNNNNNGSGSTEKGILTNISDFIKEVINEASEKLFSAFTDSDSYQAAVNAAMTLMVVIYGVSFLIGVVQPSFGEVLKRLIKMGIIYAVVSPGGWTFFSQYAVTFFNDGTDELIAGVMRIGTGAEFAAGDSPFKVLDAIAKFILSPDMIIAILGSTFAGGPYGLAMGALLGMATVGLLKMVLEGLKLYALSFIVRALLLGLAPVFFVFLLFDKTKQLFTGWLNALINLSLQPILYFTFISFFLVMIQTAAHDMLGGNELCWTEAKAVGGTTNKLSFWRFKNKDANSPMLDDMTWKGPLQCLLTGSNAGATGTSGGSTGTGGTTGTSVTNTCSEFPINIVDMLSFLILVYVASKFAGVVTRLANEISNAFVNLDTQAKLEAPKAGGESGGGTNQQAGKAPPPVGKSR